MENSLTSFVSPNALGLLVLLQPQSRSSLIIDDSRSSSVFLRFCDIYLWEKEYWEYSKLYIEQSGLVAISIYTQFDSISRKYFILWDIVNPQLGSGLGLGLGLGLGSGLGLGLGLDSLRGSTISHKMKYLPFFQRHTAGSNDRTLVFHQKWRKMRKLRETIYEKVFSACKVETTLSPL